MLSMIVKLISHLFHVNGLFGLGPLPLSAPLGLGVDAAVGAGGPTAVVRGVARFAVVILKQQSRIESAAF